MKLESRDVKKSEVAGHAIAGIGQNLVFGMWSTYTLVFFTDILGISGGVAGVIMLLTRVWDGINDPLMGTIADRTRSRWGRYRPWLLYTSLPIIVFLVLNFTAPNFSPTGKIVYAAVVYVAMSMIFTGIDVPYWTLPAAMTQNIDKRTTIYTASRLSTTVAVIAVNLIAVPLITRLGGENLGRGYQLTALMIGGAAAIFYLIGFSLVREHVEAPPQEVFKFKEAIKVISQNKPLLLSLVSMIALNGFTLLRNNMMLYYVQYNLGSLSLMPLFTLMGLPGIMLGMIGSPFLSKRYGIRNVYIAACIASAVINVAFYFTGYQTLSLVYFFYIISSVPVGLTAVMISPLVVNTIEYAEWKTGQRREGLISSTQTFASKISIAIGSGLSGLILTIVNYAPGVQQQVSTLNTFHLAMTLLTAVGAIIAIMPMLFYELTPTKYLEIVAELKQRKKQNKV